MKERGMEEREMKNKKEGRNEGGNEGNKEGLKGRRKEGR